MIWNLRFVLQIYAETEDDHFELVIANYGGRNISVEEKLNNSAVNRCHLIICIDIVIATSQSGIDVLYTI